MPRIIFLVCCGVCLSCTNKLDAQNFPKNPSLQQIVGYQMKQVQHWQMEQIPANSFLHQFKTPVHKIKSGQVPDFEPIIIFPLQPQLPIAEMQVSEVLPIQYTFNQTYADWLKQSRWLSIKKSLGN